MELTRRVSLQRPTRLDLTRLYDANAWYWDSLPHRISYGYAYIQLFKQLARDGWLRGMSDTSKVLDCGIGAGLLTDALLRTANKHFETYGIDLSQKLLLRAKAQLMLSGAVLRTVPGDIHSLPFRDGEMEMVLSALMLEHMPEPLDALREMIRVAKHGAPLGRPIGSIRKAWMSACKAAGVEGKLTSGAPPSET